MIKDWFNALKPIEKEVLKEKWLAPAQVKENFFGEYRESCPFLVNESCSIYEVRPKACSEFPHTDRKKFQQISNLTLKNVAICPAAYNIVEAMKQRIKM